MKKHIPFLLVYILILLKNNAIAMDPDIKGSQTTPQIHMIIPPEYMEDMKARDMFAALCPRIVQENPIIKSKEEFEAAKEYLGLTKKYNHLLFVGATFGPTGNEIKNTLIKNSGAVLNWLNSYIKALQGEFCVAFRSTADDRFLEHEMYDVLYKTAQNHLVLLVNAALIPNVRNGSSAVNAHLQEINKIKEQLSGNSHFHKLLKMEIREAQENVPKLVPLFNPQMQVKPLLGSKQKNRRIAQQRTINYYQKLSSPGLNDLLQDLDSFDCYFQKTSMDILTDYLAFSVKKMPLEEHFKCMQKLTDDCVSLEKRAIEFKEWLFRQSPTSQEVGSLSSNELTELYKFLCERYELPHKSPLVLLEISIFMFIQANKVEEALDRTEALKDFLLKKNDLLPDKFQTLRASVMALNGHSEEWRKILAAKKNQVQKDKANAEQKQVNQIKQQQTRIKKEQEEAEKLKSILLESVKEKKTKQTPAESDQSFDYTQIFSEEKAKPEREYALPREKIKTRNAPQGSFADKPQKFIPSLLEIKETPQLKDYPLSKNAYKIYQKIRRGDWKFSRANLSNLFQKLNCTVDFSQGKGGHGKISAPLDMMIMKEQELVAVIPEFVQKELPFPLTIPDWDEKWSGIVPHYMRKSIVSALVYVGATDETVHK